MQSSSDIDVWSAESGGVGDGQGERVTVGGQSERDGARRTRSAMLNGEREDHRDGAERGWSHPRRGTLRSRAELGRRGGGWRPSWRDGRRQRRAPGDAGDHAGRRAKRRHRQMSFHDAMQADEGVEDEQARLERGHGVLEAEAIGGQIEAQGGTVMTWRSRLRRETPAAAQMPSRRRRTMSRASSAA